MTASPELRLAATAMPIRDRPSGIELLMVRRNPELSFGGMWTFPGGALEPGDGDLPPAIDELTQNWGEPSLLTVAANAAVRETLEETALVANRTSLAWFSHWIPPANIAKRFATWFFLAPDVSGDVELDLSENDDWRWISPATALSEHAAGSFPLAVPTWVTLDDLTAFASTGELLDHAITQSARLHHTRAYKADAGRTLCWAGDAAYGSGDMGAPGPRNRVVVDDNFAVVERKRDL